MTTLIWRTAAAASLLFSLTAGAAQFEGFTPARVLPGDFKWVSTPTGLQVATIAGNQGKPGLYTEE